MASVIAKNAQSARDMTRVSGNLYGYAKFLSFDDSHKTILQEMIVILYCPTVDCRV